MTTTTTPPTQAESLLTKIKQFQSAFENPETLPGTRVLGLCNALGMLSFPNNQSVLNSLGSEEVLALRQKFLQLILEQNFNVANLFAQAVGLELPTQEFEKEGGLEADETSGTKRWTRASVLNWLNIPVKLSTGKTPFYVQSNPHVDSVVQLLGTYGPMSIYQLASLLMNQERVSNLVSPITIQDQVREALKLLTAKQLVTARAVSSWYSVNLKVWVLEIPGQIYYAFLNDLPNPTTQESTTMLLQLQHFFGTNQVLAGVAAVAATATKLGVCENIVSTVVKENPKLNAKNRAGMEIPPVPLGKSLEWARQPKNRKQSEIAGFGCRVEFMRSGTPLEIGQTERKIIVPDGMGKIIYDSDLIIPTLIEACNLTGDEEKFPGSETSGRHYWPFILEYDRATETAEFFSGKAEAYSRFYNTVQTAWPVEWGNKFPTILVVGEGSPVHLLTLMTAIRMELAEIKQNNPAHKRLGNWWFTSADWFYEVYQQYFDADSLTNWNKQVYPISTKVTKRKLKSPKTTIKLTVGPDPHIWIPLDKKLERYDVMGITNYVTGDVLQPPPIMKELKALPLPAVLNQSIF